MEGKIDNDQLCSEEHLGLFRKKDESGNEICYPIKVMENEQVGRYLVATRDIKAGEVIFEEIPLAVGPNAVSTPQCIFCHSKKIFENSGSDCNKRELSKDNTGMLHEENESYEDAIKLQILQNKLAEEVIKETFSRSELPPDLLSALHDGIISYSTKQSQNGSNTAQSQSNSKCKSERDTRENVKIQSGSSSEESKTSILNEKEARSFNDELIDLQSEQNHLSISVVEDLIKDLPKDVSNKVLHSLRENVISICSADDDKIDDSLKNIPPGHTFKDITESKQQVKKNIGNESLTDLKKKDEKTNLLDLQMSQTNLIDTSIIPKDISASLSPEMNEALKSALRHNMQVLSSPRCQDIDKAVLSGKSATDYSSHCPKCLYPVCSKCIDSPPVESCHPKLECEILTNLHNEIPLDEIKANPLDATQISLPNVMFEPVLAIRLLLLRETNPQKYSIAQSFMDHDEDRKTANPEYWEHSVTTVINPIVQSFLENNMDISFEEASKAVGICEINNYEIYNVDRRTGYRAVLPVTSLMSHSCRPNCRPIINRNYPYDSRCVANVDIPKGSDFTINYVHLTDPSPKRQKSLKHNWYFECSCSRCSDPNDAGSNLESIKCNECFKDEIDDGNGYLTRSKDQTSEFVCNGCGKIIGDDDIESLVKQLQEEKEAIDLMDIQSLVHFIRKAENILHTNHHILTTTRRWIIPLLCRPLRLPTETDIRTSFPPELYKEKIDMCQKQLGVLDICEPGMTKSRGKVLYELADSVMRLLNINYQTGKLETLAFICELKNCSEWLKEGIRCLRMERDGTFEHRICIRSEGLLKETEDFISYMQEQ